VEELRKKIFAVLFGIIIALLIGEIGLRISGYCKTYSERRDGRYINFSGCNPKNICWNVTGTKEFTITTPEFSSVRSINSLGFADKEFEKRTDSSEIRILTLGDSFTFGDGAPEDSSYPAILQTILHARFPDRKITVFNAGTCGSDPVFGYMAYTHLLKDVVAPDIIIQAFHAQDVTEDFIVRGGFERYTTDSTMKFDGVKFHWGLLYRFSHLSRLYFKNYCGYNEFFINNRVRDEAVPKNIQLMREVEQKWNKELKTGQRFFFMLHPDPIEIENNKYTANFQKVLAAIERDRGRLGVIDFRKWLVDDYHISRPDIYDIYWKKDGHHNPRGYSLMALSVADGLMPVLKERFK
jgi:hypothetical protein